MYCNLCGLEYRIGLNEEELLEEENNIIQTNRCIDCYEEWGDLWPDQI
jgi:hypothetical protein